MDYESAVPALLKLVRAKIAAQSTEEKRLVLARRRRAELRLPPSLAVSPAGKMGRRVAAKRRRIYHTQIVTAQWPQSGQETLSVPMLWCVVAGRLDFRVGEYFLHLQAGDSVVVPAGVPHPSGAQFDPPNAFCDVLILSPRGRHLQVWLTHHRGGALSTLSNLYARNPALVDDLSRIVEELQNEEHNAAPISRHLLAALWLTLERELVNQHVIEISPAQDPIVAAEGDDPIALAEQHIRAHLYRPMTLQSVAQAVHLSRSQFIVRFRARTGRSFVDYVTELRLEAACRLLRETRWTLHHICDFTGFGTTAHFHRLFRRKMGMTPIEYRHRSAVSETVR